ncbi:MAG TPA: hypothetical protein VEL76_21095 [Gemmataceae bacterium]|nr:hypothetical protein [Gemmataceae bacterium]
MLSDQDRELLTAYLDGQLSARQRKTAQRLLHRSPEAHHLLRQLQEDAHALHRLPTRKLAPDFSLKLLKTIAQRGLQPGGARPLPSPRSIPTWVGASAAAAVLFLVAGGSFVYFGDRFDTQQVIPVQTAYAPPPLDPMAAAMLPGVLAEYAKPVKPGVYIPLPELTGQDAKKRLTTELQSAPAHHLVLESRNNSAAVDRMKTVLKGAGIQVLMDPTAQAALQKKQKKQKTTYVVYAENILPDELAAILNQFGRQTKPSDRASENVLLNPMSKKDLQQLAQLMRVKEAQIEHVRLPEPIFDPTGKPPAKGKPKPPASKQAERFAVVLAMNGASGNSPPSAEVRRFLDSRSQPRPGAVRILLVLEEVSA